MISVYPILIIIVMAEDKRKEKVSAVKAVIDQLLKGEVSEDICKVIRKYPDEFHKMGVHYIDIMDMLELKTKLAFCPDPFSYDIQDPARMNYIYNDLDNPDINLSSENEKRFAEAVSFYYLQDRQYKHKVGALIQMLHDRYNREIKEIHDCIVKNDAAELFGGILFQKKCPPVTDINFYSMQFLFNKYDLHDVYNMADNRILLQWKAVLGAESVGWLDDGVADMLFTDAGIDTNRLENRIASYKIDKLRISKAELITLPTGTDTYIRCRIDGQEQKERKLLLADAIEQNPFVDVTGLAVRYFQNILDRNRLENKAVANEKVLKRINMGTVERLVDVFRHGLSKEDMMLLNISKYDNVDNFWSDTGLLEIGNEPIENQKRCAFEKLGDYLSDLRPGMLSDKEIVHASLLPQCAYTVGREGESALMKLPETFFPLIEQSQAWQNNMNAVDYVKVMRGIGRITPQIAYNSMDYFLKNRLYTEWDSMGEEEKGEQWFPNQNMKNPAEKFPPNLISEEQWTALGKRKFNQGAEFIPHGAFRKDRLTEVQVYSSGDSGIAIRCRIDDRPQGGQRLSDVDELKYNGGADVRELAVNYFMDAFARESERTVALMR